MIQSKWMQTIRWRERRSNSKSKWLKPDSPPIRPAALPEDAQGAAAVKILQGNAGLRRFPVLLLNGTSIHMQVSLIRVPRPR